MEGDVPKKTNRDFDIKLRREGEVLVLVDGPPKALANARRLFPDDRIPFDKCPGILGVLLVEWVTKGYTFAFWE